MVWSFNCKANSWNVKETADMNKEYWNGMSIRIVFKELKNYSYGEYRFYLHKMKFVNMHRNAMNYICIYICYTIFIYTQDTSFFFLFSVLSIKIIHARFSSLSGNHSIPLKRVDSYVIFDSNSLLLLFFVCLFVFLFLPLDI